MLTTGTNVEAGKSATWYIRMKVRRDRNASGYNKASLDCKTTKERLTPKNGLYNVVNGPYDHDGVSNNEACAPVRPRTIRVEKAGTQPIGQRNEDGTYPLEGAAFAIYDNQALSGAPISVLDGGSSFVSAPLEVDRSYWLVETRAPAGHVLLPRPIPFHISVGTDSAASTVIATDFGPDDGFSSVRVLPAKAGTGDAALPGIRVVDTQVGHLPVAGSTGIYPYLSAGAVLMVTAGGILWMKRREGLEA